MKTRKVVVTIEVETNRDLTSIRKDAKSGIVAGKVVQVQVNVVKK